MSTFTPEDKGGRIAEDGEYYGFGMFTYNAEERLTGDPLWDNQDKS